MMEVQPQIKKKINNNQDKTNYNEALRLKKQYLVAVAQLQTARGRELKRTINTEHRGESLLCDLPEERPKNKKPSPRGFLANIRRERLLATHNKAGNIT